MSANKELMKKDETVEEFDQRVKTISKAVTGILEGVGEDVNREGLWDTPKRYAKAMMFFTKGYHQRLSGTNT